MLARVPAESAFALPVRQLLAQDILQRASRPQLAFTDRAIMSAQVRDDGLCHERKDLLKLSSRVPSAYIWRLRPFALLAWRLEGQFSKHPCAYCQRQACLAGVGQED